MVKATVKIDELKLDSDKEEPQRTFVVIDDKKSKIGELTLAIEKGSLDHEQSNKIQIRYLKAMTIQLIADESIKTTGILKNGKEDTHS